MFNIPAEAKQATDAATRVTKEKIGGMFDGNYFLLNEAGSQECGSLDEEGIARLAGRVCECQNWRVLITFPPARCFHQNRDVSVTFYKPKK